MLPPDRAVSPRRAWLLAWLGGPLIGIANGSLRELAYKDRVGELTAHQISTAGALGLFAGYFELLARRWPLPSTRQALEVGTAWLALTVAFEFGFGRYVAHTAWRELLADYDLRKGRLWPLVLAWITLGPALVRARSVRAYEQRRASHESPSSSRITPESSSRPRPLADPSS
ncbi:MAG TPA: hypothetical protein VEX67_12795 [Solirubrobacteraceae bacterium]|nr:hypothetical protein [Solirubrobacteraceae bacterium]